MFLLLSIFNLKPTPIHKNIISTFYRYIWANNKAGSELCKNLRRRGENIITEALKKLAGAVFQTE
jgi:hypothetical protein